ncbi:MAG: two-component system sensor histidine kinase CreC [Desulfobacterales bacterium]|nr:two-component system sensor histidine kinase CreC [Desulfobacterales bacterium]
MKLGTKILLCYLLIFGTAFYYLTNDFIKNIRFRYLESVEDSMVDQAHILASLVSIEMENNIFHSSKFQQIFDKAYQENFTAKIYELNKSTVDMRVYVTDQNGILIFDSFNKDNVGADYSQWRDVYLTLKGEYGARSSEAAPDDPDSDILYVAAPVLVNGNITGVLTVGKPTTNINNFLEIARAQIKRQSIMAGLSVLLISVLIMLWITRPVKKLTVYANKIREGKKAEFPKLGNNEIGEMGSAFEGMREALEGKKYVENYVQTLTHEIKSPISAIKGAAELLKEEMTPEQRTRFLNNIYSESERIQQLIDRMLSLTALEGKDSLENIESLNISELVTGVLEGFRPVIEQKELVLVIELQKQMKIKGDSFLLRQAISNLIQNAVDFSLKGRKITVIGKYENGICLFIVQDEGPGIPDFAYDRIFEKFFSTRRPNGEKKSSGLGLNFVKEIATLHKGAIELENSVCGGVCATLTIL